MILVDTSGISEPMKLHGDPRVAAWLDLQAPGSLFISTITIAEILFGVAALPQGKRRARLAEAFETEVLLLFEGRILSFDLSAAQGYASIMSIARARGLAISVADGQIAAIAAAGKLSVATRDEKPFRAAGLKTVIPWVDQVRPGLAL
jgi:predicted nucleic acid-binding protein